jgi:diguanylate cyclase (GGDEF)-like protein/PAS domain S-box-containing protein
LVGDLPQVQEHSEHLLRHLSELDQHTQRLMRIRTDPRELFPAMPVMLERMLPAYLEFYSAATLAMDRAEAEPDDPVQRRLYKLFSEARHAFTLTIGDFRNYVANRFGVFGDPEKAMRAQRSNLLLHAERTRAALAEIEKYAKQGRLDLPQEDAYAKMRRDFDRWMNAYREVSAIYSSERWRADTPLLRDTIQPLFAHTWETVRLLYKEVDARLAQDVAVVSRTAETLSRTFWLLAALGVLATLAGYFWFERTVRRPIVTVARALRAEAEGRAEVSLPPVRTVELEDLTAAFDHMRREVRSRQQRLETILDNAAEGIITFDRDGVIEGFNHAAEKLFGWREEEVRGSDITRLIVPDTAERRQGYLQHFLRNELKQLIGHEGEVTGRHKDGSTFPMALKITEMTLEGRPLYIGLVADISERKALVEHLKKMAEHDGLTGLYNRSYFQTELERVVERVRRTGKPCALLYIDLDNFKYVNDTLGHAAGDRLLIEVAGLLHRRARKSDLIARFGGDEFTILLQDVDGDQAGQAAESFRRQLADYRFRQGGEQITIGCSIGVALIGPQTRSAEEVLSQADLACHLAKRGGRNRVHCYQSTDAENSASMSLDMGWSSRIREAIEQGRFVLACQPIVATATREIEYYEVLIRMQDDKGGYIMPSGFLPTAERFGLSVDIDRWVIVNAIETLATLRQRCPGLRFSINLSAQTLGQPGVAELVQERLEATGLDPAALMFEVTETVAIADMAAAERLLARLQDLGCRTALDDFGSGMASFAYLRDLPVDFVKIDGRFVKNLAKSPVDQAMVKAMNEIAHALGKRTIAEFIEDEESFQCLQHLGVDYAQGYHLGRPDTTLPCQSLAARSCR